MERAPPRSGHPRKAPDIGALMDGKLGISSDGGETAIWQDLPVAAEQVVWLDIAETGSERVIYLGTAGRPVYCKSGEYHLAASLRWTAGGPHGSMVTAAGNSGRQRAGRWPVHFPGQWTFLETRGPGRRAWRFHRARGCIRRCDTGWLAERGVTAMGARVARQ